MAKTPTMLASSHSFVQKPRSGHQFKKISAGGTGSVRK
jgi:hypothetical protein